VPTELDQLLATYVTPLLKERGFRKNHHFYRRTNSLGDQVALSFRGPPGDRGCFYLEWYALLVPVWEMFQAARGRSEPYPAAKLNPETSWDNGVHSARFKDPESPPNIDWGWQWRSPDQMHEVGHRVRGFLVNFALPFLETYLDRSALLAIPVDIRPLMERYRQPRPRLHVMARLALAATDGDEETALDAIACVRQMIADDSPGVRSFRGDFERAIAWVHEQRSGPA
jgi:hypothetical protein